MDGVRSYSHAASRWIVVIEARDFWTGLALRRRDPHRRHSERYRDGSARLHRDSLRLLPEIEVTVAFHQLQWPSKQSRQARFVKDLACCAVGHDAAAVHQD